MKFAFPIAGKKPEELHALNCNGAGGYYPIARNNCWHGGMHFDGGHAIAAMADGTVVSYRMTKNHLEETAEGKTYKYSNSFVLVRHEYETPKGAKLTFYSHYNHLLPWAEYAATQKKPSIFIKKGFEITANTLNIRSSKDSASTTNKVGTLLKGAKVDADAVDATWAKMAGEEKYFVHKNMAKVVAIDAEPTFDAVTACALPIKAGDVVGYAGRLEGPGAAAGLTTTHVEVFSADDVQGFITNPKKDGDKKPTFLKIKAGAALKKKESKYATLCLSQFTLKANTVVKILDRDTDPEWVQVKELELVRSVKHSWLTFHPGTSGSHYTVKGATLSDVSTAFGGMAITATTKLYYVNKEDDNRHVRLGIPEAVAGTYWAKRAALGNVEGGKAQATSEVTGCHQVNPNALKFESQAGTISEECLMKLEGMETAKDEAMVRWCKVKTDCLEGWIREDDPNVARVSAFDWPGFVIAKEDGDKASDPLIDYGKISPFFKSIVDQMNTDGNKEEISNEEMQNALKDAKLAGKLSRLICLHPSEWWTDSAMDHWKRVFDGIGEKSTTLLKARIQNLCWWSDVAGKVSGFPSAPTVYHWNPVAFVEQMKSMGSSRPPARGEVRRLVL